MRIKREQTKETMKELGKKVSQVMKFQKQWVMVLVDIVEIEIFTSVTFEYNLIINVLVIQSFIIDSKNIKLTYKRIL